MTELPLVVRMTVDSSQTDYDLSVESNTQNIELENETVIETGGSHIPVYEGNYVVDRGLSPVVLGTNGKRMTDDVTVNALTENQVTGNSLTINTSTGKVSSLVSISRGYSPSLFGVSKTLQLSTQAGTTITPTTSEQTAVDRNKYTLGAVKVGAIPSPYADVSGVTATAGDVLSGKYFVDSNGVLTLGTGTGGGGMDTETKDALLECFEHVAWADSDGQIYYNNLLNALYPLQSISAVYTQSGNVYVDTPLNDLKSDLVVTATFEDGTTKTVTNYTLSGTLTAGTSTVTVTYFTETTTFNVTVSAIQYLYELPAPFTNDGTATISTNIMPELSHTYTFLCDFAITTFPQSSAVGFVFGNKATGNSNYISLQTQLNNGSRYLWGAGIGWNNGKNIAVANNRNRIAVVCTINANGTVACSTTLKDITAGTAVKTFSNTYVAGAGITGNAYYLGKVPNGNNNESGFIGTVNTFRIYNGEMSSADIDNFITNG